MIVISGYRLCDVIGAGQNVLVQKLTEAGLDIETAYTVKRLTCFFNASLALVDF